MHPVMGLVLATPILCTCSMPLNDLFPLTYYHLMKKDKWYFASNMRLYLTGEFNITDTIDAIQEIFGSEPAGPRCSLVASIPPSMPSIEHSFDTPVPQDFIIYQSAQIGQFMFMLCEKSPMVQTSLVLDLKTDIMDSLIGLSLSLSSA